MYTYLLHFRLSMNFYCWVILISDFIFKFTIYKINKKMAINTCNNAHMKKCWHFTTENFFKILLSLAHDEDNVCDELNNVSWTKFVY
jgi:hypothetical protein